MNGESDIDRLLRERREANEAAERAMRGGPRVPAAAPPAAPAPGPAVRAAEDQALEDRRRANVEAEAAQSRQFRQTVAEQWPTPQTPPPVTEREFAPPGVITPQDQSTNIQLARGEAAKLQELHDYYLKQGMPRVAAGLLPRIQAARDKAAALEGSVGEPIGPQGAMPSGQRGYREEAAQRQGTGDPIANVTEAFTGRQRTPIEERDTPEMQMDIADKSRGPFAPGALASVLGYMSTTSPFAMQEILAKNIPGAKPVEDSRGNPMIEVDGKRFYVNKPGLSGADLMKLTADLVGMIPAARATALTTSLLGRAGISGANAGVLQGAQDLAARGLGASPETVGDITTNALTATALGAGTQFGLDKMLGFAQAVPRAPNITRGTQLVTAAGENPGIYHPADIARVSQIDTTGMSPEQINAAVRQILADQRQAATGIRQLPGEVQGTESAMKRQRQLWFKPGAEDVMQTVERERLRAIEESANRYTGGRSESEIGTEIRDRIRQARASSEADVQAAYNRVNQRRLAFTSDATDTAVGHIGRMMDDLPDPQRAPHALSRWNAVQEQFQPQPTGQFDAAGNPILRVPPMTLREIETLRKRLGTAYTRDMSETDRRMLGRMIAGLDDWIDNAASSGQVLGDRRQLTRLEAARAERRRHGQLFEPQRGDDPAGDLLEKWRHSEVEGQAAFQDVFGGGDLRGAGRSPRLIDRLQAIDADRARSGTDTDITGALRTGVLRRTLMGTGGEATEAGPMRQANRIRDALSSRGEDITSRMLDDRLRMELAQREASLRKIGERPQGGNPSGTALTLAGRGGPLALGTGLGATLGAHLGGPLGAGIGGMAGGVAGEAGGRVLNRVLAERYLRERAPLGLRRERGGGRAFAAGLPPSPETVLPSLYDLLFGEREP